MPICKDKLNNISNKKLDNIPLTLTNNIMNNYDTSKYPLTSDRSSNLNTIESRNAENVNEPIDVMTFSQFGNFITNKKSELSKFKNTLIKSSEQHI